MSCFLQGSCNDRIYANQGLLMRHTNININSPSHWLLKSVHARNGSLQNWSCKSRDDFGATEHYWNTKLDQSQWILNNKGLAQPPISQWSFGNTDLSEVVANGSYSFVLKLLIFQRITIIAIPCSMNETRFTAHWIFLHHNERSS